jgi:hypothetical protein
MPLIKLVLCSARFHQPAEDSERSQVGLVREQLPDVDDEQYVGDALARGQLEGRITL